MELATTCKPLEPLGSNPKQDKIVSDFRTAIGELISWYFGVWNQIDRDYQTEVYNTNLDLYSIFLARSKRLRIAGILFKEKRNELHARYCSSINEQREGNNDQSQYL